jgi:membrane protein
VYQKSAKDDIFLMAGAVSYNLLVASVPLFLLFAGLWGYVLSARYGDPAEAIVRLLQELIPAIGGGIDLMADINAAVGDLVASRVGYSIVGSLVFIWLSTRLVSTLRTALGRVFDTGEGRGILRGKLFDVHVVILGGVLFVMNVVVTLVLPSLGGWGANLFGVPEDFFGRTEQTLAALLAILSMWALFVLVYWYVPGGPIKWRTALLAATVMAVSYELMKAGFGWYATSVANYSSTYGNLTTLVVLLFWIYYVSLVFLLSGEIAQVHTVRKGRSVEISQVAVS